MKVPTGVHVGGWVWFSEGMLIVALLTECTKGGTLLRTKRVGVGSSLGGCSGKDRVHAEAESLETRSVL